MAEQAAASDDRFQTLFEQAPFSAQLLALDGRTLRVNKAWEALWNAPPGSGLRAHVLGEYNVLADPQLEAKGITPMLRRAFAGESTALPPILYNPAEIGQDGRPRWVRAFAHPVRDETGRVREVMLIHEDVTEQRETEQALRASEDRLKQLANTIPQLAWMADADGFIHWYNDRWYDYTGTTAEDMRGWGWQRVHDPAVLPQVLARWKHSIATGEPFEMSFPLRGRDGRFRPFFTRVAPLKDVGGRVLQWFGTNTDVSPLHDAERNLRRAEERLRLATHAGQIGIWDWDVATDSVTWSDEVYRLHGLAPGAFGGRAQDFVALVHPEDRDALWRKVQAAVDTADAFSAEFRVVLPNGHARWLQTWARAQRGPDGRAVRLVGATISIDAHKLAEAALRENDRRKDEFLAMLAHELRNPLAPISNAAHLLQSAPHDAQRVRDASTVIARQLQHITELVDDLLDVSRVTQGLIHLDMQPVEIAGVVQAAVEQVEPLMQARRHHLRTRMRHDHARVGGDRTRLVEVLVNLLNNAAKYTPEGGEVVLEADVAGDELRLSVSDNGTGIDAGLLPHVFDLFTQGARGPGRAQGGLGIGLSLVRSLVTLHGGRVRADSAGPGQGSRFTVTLPLLASAAPGPAAPAPAVQGTTPQALLVMVVDDNVDAAQSLEMLLDYDGHQVLVQHDAAGALSAAEQLRPDAFILDIGLPDCSGYELAPRLRALAPEARFIALTGYGQAQDRARSAAAGFHHHFVKPVDYAQLTQALSAAVPAQPETDL